MSDIGLPNFSYNKVPSLWELLSSMVASIMKMALTQISLINLKLKIKELLTILAARCFQENKQFTKKRKILI